MMNNDNFGIELKGESKYQIDKIILKNGNVLDMSEICHLTLIKEKNIEDIKAEFLLSFNIIDKRDFKTLSNQAFMMANVLKYIDKYEISLDEAIQLHKNLLKSSVKKMDIPR